MQFVEEMLKQAKNGNNSNTKETQPGPIDIAEINNVFKMPIFHSFHEGQINTEFLYFKANVTMFPVLFHQK